MLAACTARALAATDAPSSMPSPSPSPSAAPNARAEIGRVFTSDRTLEATSNTTRPTFTVDRATIENAGYATIAEAVANVPGLNLFSYGAFGAQSNVGIRGSSSAGVLVLQDGVPIGTASNGSVDLGSLSTAGVQRIEVVESAASTLYGSNATGGVINIITTSGAPQPYLRVAGGSYADWDVAAAAGTDHLAVSYERHTAANDYGYPGGTRTNDDAAQTNLRLSYTAHLGTGWTARFTGGDDAIDIGVPGGLSYLTPTARQATNRVDGLLDLAHTAGAGTFDLMLSSVTQKLVYLDIPDSGGEQDTFDARSQASLRYAATGTRTDVVAGVDLARESAELTFPPFDQPPAAIGAAQSQAALYTQVGYDPIAALRVIAGVRAENDAAQGGVVAPSFGTRITLGAARLTANISESFQAPTLVDLYYPGYSNPALVPEKLTNDDVTLSFPQIAGGVALGYFGRSGANLIVLDPLTYVPYNASHVALDGFQLTLATRPFHHVRATASVTDLYRALETTTGIRLPNTPPIVATLGLERPFDGGSLAFGLTLRVVGSVPDLPNPNGGPSLADPNDASAVADAYVRYALRPHVVLSLRGRNVGNDRYAPISGYPAPGRTFQVELATR
jgi:vitamin B12 transporter